MLNNHMLWFRTFVNLHLAFMHGLPHEGIRQAPEESKTISLIFAERSRSFLEAMNSLLRRLP